MTFNVCASKKRYASESEAKAAAHWMMRHHTKKRLRAYRCEACRGYHLTSRA